MTANPFALGTYAPVLPVPAVELPDFETLAADGPTFADAWIEGNGGEGRIANRIRSTFRALDQWRPRDTLRLEAYALAEARVRRGQGLPRWVLEANAYAAGVGAQFEKREEIERSIGIDAHDQRLGKTRGGPRRHAHTNASLSTLDHRRGLSTVADRIKARVNNWHKFEAAARTVQPPPMGGPEWRSWRAPDIGTLAGGKWVRELVHSEVDQWFEVDGGPDAIVAAILVEMQKADGSLPAFALRRDLFAILERLPLHHRAPTPLMMRALATALCLLTGDGKPWRIALGGVHKRARFMAAAKIVAGHSDRGAYAELEIEGFLREPGAKTLSSWRRENPAFKIAVEAFRT